jgi:hypothetical protein
MGKPDFRLFGSKVINSLQGCIPANKGKKEETLQVGIQLNARY